MEGDEESHPRGSNTERRAIQAIRSHSPNHVVFFYIWGTEGKGFTGFKPSLTFFCSFCGGEKELQIIFLISPPPFPPPLPPFPEGMLYISQKKNRLRLHVLPSHPHGRLFFIPLFPFHPPSPGGESLVSFPPSLVLVSNTNLIK